MGIVWKPDIRLETCYRKFTMFTHATRIFSHHRFFRKGIIILLALTVLLVGMFIYQRHYIDEHLPQIRAGMTKADAEGGNLMAGIGAPPGAKALSAVEKIIGKGGPVAEPGGAYPITSHGPARGLPPAITTAFVRGMKSGSSPTAGRCFPSASPPRCKPNTGRTNGS